MKLGTSREGSGVTIVPVERLADVWPEVCAWIEEAVKVNQGDENTLDVFVGLARGQYMLWHVPGRYCAVVQITRFPRQTVATVLYTGGAGLEAMRETFEEGKRWCRANGVNVIRTHGREGWARVMGLKHVGVILQEDVT